MTDYIKIPTTPTQDLLRGIEAISPYPRISPYLPRQDGYSRQSKDSAAEKEGRAPRRFASLRRLINALQKNARISRVDFTTADEELQQLGFAIIDAELPLQLQQLKIPPESIDQLQLQIDTQCAAVSLATGRRIKNAESILFPVSTQGLSEYNLTIEELEISPGMSERKIVEQVAKEGLFIAQRNCLSLTFSRVGPPSANDNASLKLKISVLLGVMESDDAERRAILYPRGDNSYGLYADKLIDLSI